jgi:hypothetical protein
MARGGAAGAEWRGWREAPAFEVPKFFSSRCSHDIIFGSFRRAHICHWEEAALSSIIFDWKLQESGRHRTHMSLRGGSAVVDLHVNGSKRGWRVHCEESAWCIRLIYSNVIVTLVILGPFVLVLNGHILIRRKKKEWTYFKRHVTPHVAHTLMWTLLAAAL